MRAVLALALLCVGCGERPAGEGTVTEVSDGDTLRVIRRGEPVKVRLWGVDAPEIAQPYGALARDLTTRLVLDKVVTLDVRDTDRYGRLVCVVRWPDGNLNERLLSDGAAWWYKAYARRQSSYRVLEEAARAGRRGLWRNRSAQPPWVFRSKNRRRG